MNVDRAMDYLEFAQERHKIWELRQADAPAPWTDDPILANRKFTNTFRVLDYGSQFFIRELLDAEPRDVLARAIFYRFTNRPETWQALRGVLGHYPLAADLNTTTAEILCFLRDEGLQVFSGAYTIIFGTQVKHVDKSRESVLFAGAALAQAWPAFARAGHIWGRYASLRSAKGMGDFLTMQVITDYGYAGIDPDEEDAFIVPGPGAVRGAKIIAPEMKAVNFIHWAQDHIVGTSLPNGRTPTLMDVQNTLCEFQKLVRYQGMPPGHYRPAHPGQQPAPILPKHW